MTEKIARQIAQNEDKHNTDNPNQTDNIELIITTLNNVTDKNYKPNLPITMTLIENRLYEGYDAQDFITVIEKKAHHWKTSKKMNKYLRPSTLFNQPNFENYLNEDFEPPE